jgi:DNA-binding response OmpR family regulator
VRDDVDPAIGCARINNPSIGANPPSGRRIRRTMTAMPSDLNPSPPATDGRGARVLVVDDEPMVREVVVSYLERDGFRVSEASDGVSALRSVLEDPPDLVVLDIMLPVADGLEVLGEIRKRKDIPVILLTARTEEVDRVLGLELGADDYVVKPFSPRELTARVRSVLRRARPAPPTPSLEFDGLVIDGATREVAVEGNVVEMTPKEFDLLAFLAASPKQVFSRAQLLEHVWDSSPDYQDPSTVTVHIRRIRQKIEADPDDPRWVCTVWGVGYKFQP